MKSDLHQLAYCSMAVEANDAAIMADLRDIISVARVRNPRDGITGALLWSGPCFAQVIEGPLAPVERLLQAIRLDPRHRNLVVVQSKPVPERDFADWSMALTGIPSERNQAAPVFERAFSGPDPATAADLLTLVQIALSTHQLW